MKNFSNAGQSTESSGFTLTEMMVAVAITGVLSTIAFPKYINQIYKTKQNEAKAIVAQVMNQTSAYNDEFGSPANGWSDLDEIATLMTDSGNAAGSSFSEIILPGKKYRLFGEKNKSKYIFTSECTGDCPSNLNIVGCINVATGASNIQSGIHSKAAAKSDLTCP
jgi:type IV pilus assembly protein PilA